MPNKTEIDSFWSLRSILWLQISRWYYKDVLSYLTGWFDPIFDCDDFISRLKNRYKLAIAIKS